MKKNGTPFKEDARRLTLVDSAGDEISHTQSEDAAADFPPATAAKDADVAPPSARNPHQVLVFVAVSLACATAALAAGTYAVWLTRRQAAQNALTDVRDLLRTCQDRMVQMEEELHRLPRPASYSPTQ